MAIKWGLAERKDRKKGELSKGTLHLSVAFVEKKSSYE